MKLFRLVDLESRLASLFMHLNGGTIVTNNSMLNLFVFYFLTESIKQTKSRMTTLDDNYTTY